METNVGLLLCVMSDPLTLSTRLDSDGMSGLYTIYKVMLHSMHDLLGREQMSDASDCGMTEHSQLFQESFELEKALWEKDLTNKVRLMREEQNERRLHLYQLQNALSERNELIGGLSNRLNGRVNHIDEKLTVAAAKLELPERDSSGMDELAASGKCLAGPFRIRLL